MECTGARDFTFHGGFLKSEFTNFSIHDRVMTGATYSQFNVILILDRVKFSNLPVIFIRPSYSFSTIKQVPFACLIIMIHLSDDASRSMLTGRSCHWASQLI